MRRRRKRREALEGIGDLLLPVPNVMRHNLRRDTGFTVRRLRWHLTKCTGHGGLWGRGQWLERTEQRQDAGAEKARPEAQRAESCI